MARFEACLIGQGCRVGRREHGWAFALSGGVLVAVSTSWRIVSEGGIAVGSCDDGLTLGGASPADGEAEARWALDGKVITAATVDRETADLTLQFGEATRIDVFNGSSAHEGWQAAYRTGDADWSIIARGGGELAFVGPGVSEPRSATEG